MNKTINGIVSYKKNEKIISATIIGERGDYVVLNDGFGDSLVHKDDLIDLFNDGGLINIEEYNIKQAADVINSMFFYRYYPKNANPFEVSYEPTNKYGFGMYFLDNADFYKNKFEDAMLVKIKPNVKAPFVLTYHKRLTPSFEYAKMFHDLKEKGSIKTKYELSVEILKSGFDSIVIYEPRGIYLIILKDGDSLFDVISDKSAEEYHDGGFVGDDSYLLQVISDFANKNYTDLSQYQSEILYRNFIDDIDGVFFPSVKDEQVVKNLIEKGYLKVGKEDCEFVYSLDVKGVDFIKDLSNVVC